jgi:hypothetical protein
VDEDPEDTLEVITGFVGTLEDDADANNTFLGFKFTQA